MPPYEFFSQVLTADGGRRAIMNRLGTEAGEPLDAFLSLALEFAPGRAGALQTFLAAVEDSGAEIKRDMDQGANEVRVMTVHGAKGLEAPIVFLPDTCDPPSGPARPRHPVRLRPGNRRAHSLWRLKKALETSRTEALRQAQQERERQEYNRLLYVAMTRARDRLYVGGCQTTARNSSRRLLVRVHRAPPCGRWRRKLRTRTGRVSGASKAAERCDRRGQRASLSRPSSPPSLPAGPCAMRRRSPPPCTGSSPRASRTPPRCLPQPGKRVASPLAGTEEHRFRRGRLIHRLLQALPDLPPPARADAGRRYLDRAAGELAQLSATRLTKRWRSLRSPRSRPVRSRQPGRGAAGGGPGRRGNRFGLTGQIDRLAVSDDEVVIADYKTNRPPPASPEDTDPVYIRQLAAYRCGPEAALSRPRDPLRPGVDRRAAGHGDPRPAA
jgi:ATP-dependent helicase/nuclease subunit A